MKTWLNDILARVAPLVDRSALLLGAIGLSVLLVLDWRAALTLAQWSVFALVIGSIVIVISRVTFPQLKLSELVERVKAGDLPAALVVAALLVYCGLAFVGVALWAK